MLTAAMAMRTPPIAAAHRRGIADARGERRDGLAEHRVDELRRELEQRLEHEAALVEPRVRHHQIRLVDRLAP